MHLFLGSVFNVLWPMILFDYIYIHWHIIVCPTSCSWCCALLWQIPSFVGAGVRRTSL